MPRGPKKSANQHSNRHENGIVAPGRRIARQRSNGQLKETAVAQTSTAAKDSDASSRADNSPVPTPSPVEQQQLAFAGPPVSRQGPPIKDRSSSASQQSPAANPSTLSPCAGDGMSAEGMTGMDGGALRGRGVGEQQGKRADGTSGTRASLGREEGGTLHLVTTVLSSWSLADSIAVLVFLLSLPAHLHSLVNAAFTITTFVPPSGSFTSLPTLSDFVSSFSPNTPSFAVIVVIDCLAMLLWLFLPNMFQALVIDSAQAVVATTLGGGHSNKPGAPDNTLWCLGFATISHFVTRYKRSICRILHRTWIGRWTPEYEGIEGRPLSQDYPVGYERGWLDTIKVLIALHIVCQGLTKMVRRSLVTSRVSSTITSGGSLASTVPSKGGEAELTTAGSSGVDREEGIEHARHQPQLRSKESLANLKDVNRDKISSGKRRRKQANFVRNQQPLWAAFALFKVLLARLYSLSRASEDGKGTGATDAENLGDSPFEKSRNKIWITRIQPNSFFFETGPIESSLESQRQHQEEGEGVDRSRPFYVNINGADWISLKMVPVPETEDKGRCQWTGEIYGLSPAYSYHVDFLRSDDDSEIHSEVIATPAMVQSTQASAALPPPQVIRPSSPASPKATLLTSIDTLERSLEDTKERAKKLRKDSKQTQGNLRKEIDVLNDKISKQANSVQSFQARQAREHQHIRQAEDAISSMSEELDAWKEIPEEEVEDYKARKTEHDATRNEHSEAKSDLVRAKNQNNRNIALLNETRQGIQQKNERASQRVTRLKNQHSRLTNPEPATAPIPTGPAAFETQRSNSDPSVNRTQQREERRNGWRNMIEGRERMIENLQQQYQFKVYEVNQLQRLLGEAQRFAEEESQRQAEEAIQRPRTPSEDGQLPGTVPQPPSTGNPRPFFDLFPPHSQNLFGSPDRNTNATSFNTFDPFMPSSSLVHKTNSTGGHGKTINSKPNGAQASSIRPRSTSIMSGNTIYQDFTTNDDGNGGTEGSIFEQAGISSAWPSVPGGHFKRRSGGIGLVREGSLGGNSSGSASPRVIGGITRPPPTRDSQWHAAEKA